PTGSSSWTKGASSRSAGTISSSHAAGATPRCTPGGPATPSAMRPEAPDLHPYDAGRDVSRALICTAQSASRARPVVALSPVSAAVRDRMGVLLIEDDDEDAFLVEGILAESSLDVRVVRGRTLREAL